MRSVASGIEEIRDAIRSGDIRDFRDPQFSNVNYIMRLRDLGAVKTTDTKMPTLHELESAAAQ
jgi:hypothetical protein